MADSTDSFGRIGFFDGEVELSRFSTGDADDSGLLAGFGVLYDFTEKLAIQGGFDWYDTDLDTLFSLSVSLQYRFGD